MHGIGTIGAHLTASSSQGAGVAALSDQSGSTFQLAPLTNSSSQSVARGVSATVSPSLGSQSLSTLLQTQDINQTQVQGGGHGGGGGHHGMKMMPSLEAEEAAESEEAQNLREHEKLTKKIKTINASETAKIDENGDIVEDVEQTEANKRQNNEGGLNS